MTVQAGKLRGEQEEKTGIIPVAQTGQDTPQVLIHVSFNHF